MKTTAETRQANLLRLIADAGSQADFARRIRKDPRQVSQWKGMKGARSLSDPTAREIEAVLMLPRGWMDQPHGPDAPIQAETQPGGAAGQIAILEQEIGALTGVLSVLLNRLGAQLPAEGALVALELRRFLATPGYEGVVAPQLLRAAEAAVPSSVSGAQPMPSRSAK